MRRIWIGVGWYGLWYLLFAILHPQPLVDESAHQAVISGMYHGQADTSELPMLPVYHWLIATLSAVTGPSLNLSRFFTVAISALAMPLCASIRWPSGVPAQRSPLLVAFLPILFPYTSMVYTDGVGLVLVVAAVWVYAERRHVLSAVFGLGACLIRQSSIVWVGFIVACGIVRAWEQRPADGPDGHRRAPIDIRELIPLSTHVVALGVIGFILLTRGSLLASPVAMNRPQPNISNYYTFAFLALLLWLPLWIGRVRGELTTLLHALRTRPMAAGLTTLALAGLGGVLVATYSNWHPWGQYRNYLGNLPLIAMQRSIVMRVVGVLCAFAAVWLVARFWSGQPNRRYLWLLAACMAAFLSFHAAVDPRYFIVFFVLADLLVAYTPVQERVLAAWYAGLGVGVAALFVSDIAVW